MTAALDLAPDAHPVVAGAREIAIALDRMQAGVTEPLTASEVSRLVADLDRIVRRVEAVKLRVLVQGAASSAAADAGFASTGSWLAQQTRMTGRDADRQVRLADRLETAPRTGAALASGDLSPTHAAVVTDALGQLPHRVTTEQRGQIEAELVRKAARLDPARLRREARRALAVIEPDPVVVDAHESELLAAEEDAAQAKTKLTLHDNGDGTTSGHFTVPTLAGDILRKVLDAMTAPRRQGARAVPMDGAPLADWRSGVGRRSWSCSSTCPPTTCTRKPPRPSWCSFATTSCSVRLPRPASTPTTRSVPVKPGGLRAQRGSSPPCWAGRHCRSTSVVSNDCSPRPSAWPLLVGTPTASPRGVSDRSRGASCTTANPGHTVVGPTSTKRSRSARTITT